MIQAILGLHQQFMGILAYNRRMQDLLYISGVCGSTCLICIVVPACALLLLLQRSYTIVEASHKLLLNLYWYAFVTGFVVPFQIYLPLRVPH